MGLTGNYDANYFRHINQEEGPQAERLAELLQSMYKPKSVADIGCATGLYLAPFHKKGIDVVGIDYAPDVIDKSVLQIPKSKVKVADITKKPPKMKKSDLAICLEVFEHIPATGADTAIKFLTKTSDTIVFSAAQVGQGGEGHINCQPKSYWAEKFWENGFILDIKATKELILTMANGYHMGWFVKNAGVYVKR